jgi:DNA-binding NarL/FixJ family response regulator
MLIYGHGITDISSLLNLQMSTVSTYKNRIFEKLNVTNIVQLIDKFRFWKITNSN